MDVRPEILLLILGCALITTLQRITPITLLRNWQPPKWFVDWLGFVPTAVMSALIGLAIFFPEKDVLFWLDIRPFFYASLPTAVVAFVTRSLGITVLVGIIAMYGVLRIL